MLKEWRLAQQLTLEAAAERLGWSYSNYRRIELGEQEPTAEQLRTIAVFTGIEPDDLLFEIRA